MSINSETSHLNPAGQVLLAVIASAGVNVVVHPISTYKNRQQARSHVGSTTHHVALCKNHIAKNLERSSKTSRMSASRIFSIFDLYKGYGAICGVDAAAFGIAYVTNDAFQNRFTPFTASIIAGTLSAPVVAIGETAMIGRQVLNQGYWQSLRRSLRLSSLITTFGREVPFAPTVFCLAPRLQSWVEQRVPTHYQSPATTVAVQALTGATSGAIAGLLTAPPDLIKTRIQASEQPLSIWRAMQQVVAEEGWRGLGRGSGLRASYVGGSVAIMHVINNILPQLLPAMFQTK